MLQLTVKTIVWKHLPGKANILENIYSELTFLCFYRELNVYYFFEALKSLKTNLNQNRPRQMTHVEKETNVKRINIHVIHYLSCTHITFAQQPRWQVQGLFIHHSLPNEVIPSCLKLHEFREETELYWILKKYFIKSPYFKCSFDSDPLPNGQIIAILLEWTIKNHGRHNNQSQHIAIPEKLCSRYMLYGLFNVNKGISHFLYKNIYAKLVNWKVLQEC